MNILIDIKENFKKIVKNNQITFSLQFVDELMLKTVDVLGIPFEIVKNSCSQYVVFSFSLK